VVEERRMGCGRGLFRVEDKLSRIEERSSFGSEVVGSARCEITIGGRRTRARRTARRTGKQARMRRRGGLTWIQKIVRRIEEETTGASLHACLVIDLFGRLCFALILLLLLRVAEESRVRSGRLRLWVQKMIGRVEEGVLVPASQRHDAGSQRSIVGCGHCLLFVKVPEVEKFNL